MTASPIERAIDEFLSWESDKVAWLRRAGPIAERLNRESREDEILDAMQRDFGSNRDV